MVDDLFERNEGVTAAVKVSSYKGKPARSVLCDRPRTFCPRAQEQISLLGSIGTAANI